MLRRSLTAVVIAVLVAAPTTAGAAMTRDLGAVSTEQGFLNAEHPWDTYWGVPATDKQLLDIGRTACTFHGRGMSDVDVLTAMMGGPSMLPPAGTEARERGLQRVRNAVRYLCP